MTRRCKEENKIKAFYAPRATEAVRRASNVKLEFVARVQVKGGLVWNLLCVS